MPFLGANNLVLTKTNENLIILFKELTSYFKCSTLLCHLKPSVSHFISNNLVLKLSCCMDRKFVLSIYSSDLVFLGTPSFAEWTDSHLRLWVTRPDP